MISVEKLKQVTHIVTHKDCADGIASAMILRDVLSAKVTFLHYGTDEQKNLEAEPGMLFCDFSPDRERATEFEKLGAIVLDHHKFAKDVVEVFGENGIFADEKLAPGVCGAVLAYEHVWKPLEAIRSENNTAHVWSSLDSIIYPRNDIAHEAVSNLAVLAGIRDTWQKHDSRWVAACEQAEALRFWPLENLVGTYPSTWPDLIQPGSIIFARNLERASDTADNAYRFTSAKGTRVIIFSGTGLSSDTAEVAQDVDLVVGFGYKSNNGKVTLIFSTRSHTDFDCGAFCHSHGGGGHTKSAGFSVEVDIHNDTNPFRLFMKILDLYEDPLQQFMKILGIGP